MSFDKDITPMAMNPAVLLPAGVLARRALPPAVFPVVGIPIPTMVAVDPYIIAFGCATTVFNYNPGRRNGNEYLRRQARRGRQYPREH